MFWQIYHGYQLDCARVSLRGERGTPQSQFASHKINAETLSSEHGGTFFPDTRDL